MDRNQPAPDVPNETAETLDPNATWCPQPSRIYSEADNAATEGARRSDAIAEADALMSEMQDTTGGCAEQGHPFVIADHEVQHTGGDVKTDLEFDIALRSGEGQSGAPGPAPVILPNLSGAPPGEVSIISLPVGGRRQGT